MINKIYMTETFDKEHRHPGGIIYSQDFNTNYRIKNNRNGSPTAARIAADLDREQKGGV